ncbi:hypothetical protein SLS58_008759 [Diplodia intermedia]|uniref:Uncharacterized protein n=1 Tax=Diplodia intermedia TaxID=856260 RepID=A0ABR3TGU1_9PEZI
MASVEKRSSPVSTRGGLSYSSDYFNTSQVNGQAISRVYGIEALNLSYPLCTNSSTGSEIPPFRNSKVPNQLHVKILTLDSASTSTVRNIANVDVFEPHLDCEFATLETVNYASMLFYADGIAVDNNGQRIDALPWVAGSEFDFDISVRVSSPSCSRVTASGKINSPVWTIFSEGQHLDCSENDRRFVIGIINSFDEKAGNISNYPDFVDDSPGSLGYLNIGEALNITLPGGDVTRFLDQKFLLDSFEKLYLAVTVQLSNAYLLQNSNKTFEIAEVQKIDRIQLRGPAFWMTETFILTLVLICLSLTRILRKGYVICDPGPIAGTLGILTSSPAFMKLLRGHGLSGPRTLGRALRTLSFQTKYDSSGSNGAPSFSIVPLCRTCATEDAKRTFQARKSTTPKWYVPFIMQIHVRAFLVLWAIALVASLEIVYSVSYSGNGLYTITEKPYVEYSLRYVPITVMLLFGTAMGALDFEIKTLEPFHRMRRGPVSATISIDEHYLGRVGVHALWTAVRRRQWCTIATSIGMVLSPFLTILAGGLYYADAANDTTAMRLRQVDYFEFDSFTNLDAMNVQGDGTMAANLVINDNMDLPDWTYQTFAIPKLNHYIDPLPTRPGSHLRVDVPAARPVANCTSVPVELLALDDSASFDFKFPSLPPCGNNTRNTTEYAHRKIPKDTLAPVGEGFFGKWIDRDGMDYHCPEYLALIGHLSRVADTTTATNLTALHCSPYLERLDATVSLTYPDLHTLRTTDGLPTAAPTLDESRKQPMIPLEIRGLGTSILEPYVAASEMAALGNVDGFFGTLVRNNASSLPDLIAAADPTALQSAVERLYARTATQIVSANRNASTAASIYVATTAAAADLGRPRNATLYQPNRLRVRQNALPTHALAALLSATALCVAATFMMSAKEVLPKNPRSIAAVASLLAGAAVLRRWPECRRGEGFGLGFWRVGSGAGGAGVGDGSGEFERAGGGGGTGVWGFGDGTGGFGAGEDDRGEEAAMVETGNDVKFRFGIDVGTPDEV